MKTIIISGTPGTGKTTLAKELADRTKFEYIDVNQVIESENLCTEYDKKRTCNIINIGKLNKALKKLITKSRKLQKKGIIIDSHLSHYLPANLVDLCIITKCDLKELKNRLETRNYSKNKVKENIECEIFDICLIEAREIHPKLTIIDTSKKIKWKKIIELL